MDLPISLVRSDVVYRQVVQIRQELFDRVIAKAQEAEIVHNAFEEAGQMVDFAIKELKDRIVAQFPEERDKTSVALLLITQPLQFRGAAKDKVMAILEKKEISKKKNRWLNFLWKKA